jgi:hypothetical protein
VKGKEEYMRRGGSATVMCKYRIGDMGREMERDGSCTVCGRSSVKIASHKLVECEGIEKTRKETVNGRRISRKRGENWESEEIMADILADTRLENVEEIGNLVREWDKMQQE